MAAALGILAAEKMLSVIQKKKRKHGSDSTTEKRVKTSAITAVRRQLDAVRPEIKCVDLNTQMSFDNAGSSNANVVTLNCIAEGSDFYQRIGREVKIASIQLVCNIIPGGTYPAAADRLKVALVYDRMPNGTTPTIQDIFLDVDKSGGTKCDPESHINLSNRKRFKILLHQIRIAPYLASATSQPAQTNIEQTELRFETYRRFKKPLTTIYNTTTALPAAIQEGSLLLIAYSVTSTTAASTWGLNYCVRIRYTG